MRRYDQHAVDERRAALKLALKLARKKRQKWTRMVDAIDDQLKSLLFADDLLPKEADGEVELSQCET